MASPHFRLTAVCCLSVLAAACTKSNPVAATSIPMRPATAAPIFMVSGQSNACPLANLLSLYGPVRTACSGGTPISAWSAQAPMTFPTNWHWVWPDLAANLAYPPKPDVFVWWQGDSDAIDDVLVERYEAAATDLLKRVRALSDPSLVVVIVGLSDYQAYLANWQRMRLIQERLAHNDPRGFYVRSDDLEGDGGTHMTPTGYAHLATRIYETVRPSLPVR